MSQGRHEQCSVDPTEGSPCLKGERVTFTGTLASMPHRLAYQLVEQHGGVASRHISRQTTMLVIGEEGWPLESDGQPSQKLQYADQLWQQGSDVRFVNESEWLHLLGLDDRRREVHRLYTPAMLSQLLDVPVGVIRSWERAGLIKAVRKVYRLPYFDFQEVTCARRITQLLDAGVSCRTVKTGIANLKASVPGVECPLTQLDVLARGRQLLYRDHFGLVDPTRGQRCFDFDPLPARPAEERFVSVSLADTGQDDVGIREQSSRQVDWFVEGCRFLDDGNPEDAVEAFRLSLMDKPGDAETNFHLAETLYRLGNSAGALERYFAVVEADHDYIEAWSQLGCLLAERGKPESALQAFDLALSTHHDYPDAHLHKAEVLHQLGQIERAVPHWQQYLEFDSRGPWAEQARQRLEEAGRLLDHD